MQTLVTSTPDMAQVKAALKAKKPQAAIWTITPNIAAFLSDADPRNPNAVNAGNRDTSAPEISALARDMASGAWMLTGDSVKLGSDGTLLDGQHRLFACVRANLPFTTLVLCGVDPAFYTTMDTGKGKSAADIFKKSGIKYHSVVASATQQLRRFTSASPISDRAVNKPHILLDLFYKEWFDLVDFAKHPDVMAIKRNLKHPHATLTALYALFSRVDADAARRFFAEWAAIPSPEATPKNSRSPVHTLQRALHERNANLVMIGGRVDDRDRVLMMVKAWRAFVFNERVTSKELGAISARAGTPWPGVKEHDATTGDKVGFATAVEDGDDGEEEAT